MSAAEILRIVGVDTSLASTGVASWLLADPGVGPKLVGAEAIVTASTAHATHVDRARRVKRIAREVELWTRHPDTLMVIEGLGFSRGATTNASDLAHLWWTVVSRHLDFDGQVAVVGPTLLKKWTTGVGNCDKAALAAVVARLCPQVHVVSSDVSDALALSLLGQHLIGWRDEPAAYRRDALTKIAWANGAAA